MNGHTRQTHFAKGSFKAACRRFLYNKSIEAYRTSYPKKNEMGWNKSGKMKQFLADNMERIDYRYFPAGRSQQSYGGILDALKRNPLMHEHYDNVDERVGRTLYFLQNSRISIDCEMYIFGDPKPIANLF